MSRKRGETWGIRTDKQPIMVKLAKQEQFSDVEAGLAALGERAKAPVPTWSVPVST